ncbi:AAA family ATPase [Streptomyces sp. NBC_00096]|uniref:AAA family ATPase n=1 Tax=Streptomyces sp. NBC_00096 TaxID=2975650 RepID=UPI00324DA4B4
MAVAVKDPSTVFADVGVDTFRGRTWLIDRIDAFRARHRCGFIWIEGDAGVGKTALAAHLVSRRGYVAHFARLAGGTTTRVALRNLAGQLIEAYGLADFAPGGMLPEWAHSPEGFEAVLTAAATAAGKAGEALILVLDGLDEAEQEGHELPWGIQALLPNGVFVLGTYRTGHPLGPTDSNTVTLRLDVDDPRNQADILEYLQIAVTEEKLSAALAAADVTGEAFTRALAHQCAGVWVYLRYVLDEVRIGLRHPVDIDTLEAGLPHYYASQMVRWEAQDSWLQVGAPLVAVLAALREPATADHIRRLAGVKEARAVHLWCDRWLRPFLTVDAAAERVYAIYHASAREFFGGGLPPAVDGHPDHWMARAEGLRRGRRSAHSRIADVYLDIYGGLDEGLPYLAADPSLAGQDSAFALRHLTHHLIRAGRGEDVHSLLRIERHGPGEGRSNVWFAAHDHTDGLDEYLEDLALARRDAEAATDGELAGGIPPCSWALEARYALMRSCMGSLADSFPPELALELVESGHWTPARALDHARRLIDSMVRPRILLDLRPHLPEQMSLQVLQEVTAECRSRRGDPAGAGSLTGAVFWRGDRAQPDEVEVARAAIESLPKGESRLRNFLELIPFLSPDARKGPVREVLEGLSATDDPHQPTWMLLQLLPFLDPDARTDAVAEVLNAAEATPKDERRIRWKVQLLPYLTGEQRDAVTTEVLADAHMVPFDVTSVWVLDGLADNLSSSRLAELVRVTIDSVPRGYLGQVLPDLAPHLEAPLIAQVLAAARECPSGHARISAFCALVEHLRDEERAQVRTETYAMIRDLPPDWGQASRWIDVMEEAPDDLLPLLVREVLDLLANTTDAAMRGHLVGLMTPYLDDEEVAEALDLVRSLPDDRHLAAALVSLAAQQPEAQESVFADALDIVRRIPEATERARGLEAIAAQLPEVWLRSALDVALASEDEDAADSLDALAPWLPRDLMAVAVEAALALEEADSRHAAVNVLLPHLPEDLALRVLTTVLAEEAGPPDPELLRDWAPFVPAVLQSRITSLCESVGDPAERIGCLLAIGTGLPHTLRQSVAKAGLELACGSPERGTHRLLEFVAPHLEDADFHRAVGAARAITSPYEQALALVALAGRMSSDAAPAVYAEALSVVAAADYDTKRWFLAEAGAALPADQMATALTWPDSIVAWWLELGHPELPQALVPKALEVILGQDTDWWVAKGLPPLAAALPEELLRQAMASAPAEDGKAPAAIIRRACELRPDRPAADTISLLRTAIDRSSREAVLVVLAAAAEPLARLSPSISEACLGAVEDVRSWW